MGTDDKTDFMNTSLRIKIDDYERTDESTINSSSVSEGYDIVHLTTETELGEMEIVDKTDLMETTVEIKDDVKDDYFDSADETGSEEDDTMLIYPGSVRVIQLRSLKFRWYLVVIGQWFPKSWLKVKQFRFCLILIQIVYLSLLFTYLSFLFGLLGNVAILVVDGSNYPFTTARNIVWEFRWSLTYFLGIIYHHTGHFEVFLATLRLPGEIVKKANRLKIIYFAILIILILVIPTCLHLSTLFAESPITDLYDISKIGLYSTCFALYRLICLPSFCVITIVLYLVKAQLYTLGRELCCLNVNLGLSYAKHEIRTLKRTVRNTDTALKWYLVCHLILILFSAFTGIFSCIERLQFSVGDKTKNASEIVWKQTVINPGWMTPAKTLNGTLPVLRKFSEMNTKLTKLELSIAFLQNTISIPARNGSLITSGNKHDKTSSDVHTVLQGYKNRLGLYRENLLALSVQSLHQPPNVKPVAFVMISNMTNPATTGDGGIPHVMVKIFEKIDSLRAVILDEVSCFLEIIALYLVPLYLLAWHERTIQKITDEIIDLDIEEQRRKYFLFDTEAKKDEIVKYLITMKGVSIFGAKFSFYKAAFVSVLSPFIAITLHYLFKHFHLW